MKRLLILLIVCIFAIQASMAQSAYILPAREFNKGFNAVKPNIYFVWAHANAAFTLQIAGQEVSFAASDDADAFEWKQIGKIKVEEQSNLSIKIKSKTDRPSVAYISLSADEFWKPEVFIQHTKLFSSPADRVEDNRAGIIRTTRDHYYHFSGFASKRDWLARKMELRDHLKTTMGVQPMPPKTPLHAKVFDRVERDGYSIEKVYFESYPGYYVTGNLYRPLGKEGPFPAILTPHGHWGTGRLAHEEHGSVPGRCINLARQGHIVFSNDMVGYVDSKQLDHNFSTEREWLWGITLHGVQFWNSIRSIDFLLSLDDVDSSRIGCTGASGGGTQTFFLTAVDERVHVSAPVNMISSHFQGGCLCENAANLRIEADNVEYGAMMAPRPLMMVATTGDWTTENPWVEYPAIRSVYQLFDAASHVDMVQMDAPHNYNKDSREAVYAFFGKWFLDDENPGNFVEQPFTIEPENNLRVFPDELPGEAASEEELVRYLQRTAEEMLKEHYPDTKRGLQNLRYNYVPALKHSLGVTLPNADDIQVERLAQIKNDTHFVHHVILSRHGMGDQIPGILLVPRSIEGVNKGALLLHEDGKAGWFDPADLSSNQVVQSLLDDNTIVFLPDLFLTGEHHNTFASTKRNTDTSHYYTYNQSDSALRVQDILTSLTFLQSHTIIEHTSIIAEGDAGLWSVLAAPFAENIDALIADANQFPTGRDGAYMDQLYIPGLRRAGDFRVAQSLIAPTPLMIHNTDGVFHTAWGKDAYETEEAKENLIVKEQKASNDELLQWLEEQL